MAKRALFSRLSRLELPGRKPKEDSGPRAVPDSAVRNPIASLELKVGEETRRLPSPKAVKEEKIKLEKVRKIETREQALRVIEKFREKERVERGVDTDRHWQADESDRASRAEDAIQKVDRGWKIARIALRLVFGFFLLYVGLRGTFNLIDLMMHPRPGARVMAPSAVWVGVGFVLFTWLVRTVRARLVAYDGLAWVPYARTVFLAWTPLLTLTAVAFFSGMVNPSAEAFLRMSYVFLYVALLSCWFHFLTEV